MRGLDEEKGIKIHSGVRKSFRRSFEAGALFFVAVKFLMGLTAMYSSPIVDWIVRHNRLPSINELPDIRTSPADLIVPAVIFLVFCYVFLVISRYFWMDDGKLSRKIFTENVAFGYLNMLVGLTVLVIVVVLGLIALIIPGFYLFVSLVTFFVIVSVEDMGFKKAMSKSWVLVEGRRWRVLWYLKTMFLIEVSFVVIAVVIGFLINSMALLLHFLLPLSLALVFVFSASGTVNLYRQLIESEDWRRSRDDGNSHGDVEVEIKGEVEVETGKDEDIDE
ncbi:MAG: hypothetical protein ABEK59_03990 [Halobacteria archaeon]